MKKLLTLLLAALFTFGFVACGNQATQESEATEAVVEPAEEPAEVVEEPAEEMEAEEEGQMEEGAGEMESDSTASDSE